MLRDALYNCTGPAAIRYPRGHEGAYTGCAEATLLKEGTDCSVLCYGPTVNTALSLDAACAARNISLEILKPGVIKPLDYAPIESSVRKTGRLLVIEECSDPGCLADEIFSHLACAGIRAQCRKRNLGDRFFPHGSPAELQKLAGLDAESLLPLVLEVMSANVGEALKPMSKVASGGELARIMAPTHRKISTIRKSDIAAPRFGLYAALNWDSMTSPMSVVPGEPSFWEI